MVEDQKPTQTIIDELLQCVPGDFEVVACIPTEAQAMDWVSRHRDAWDMALVDLMLTEGTGFGVIRRCKSVNPDARVAVFSDFASPAVKSRCLELGADTAISKADFGELYAYLESVGTRAGVRTEQRA
jgi:DNA-binding NarL/FixJ family response regulator